MVDIILSPSQQKWNKCILGDTEQDHTFVIAEKAYELLKNSYDGCNVCLIYPKDGTEQETLTHVVQTSNHFVTANPAEKSYHIDIHTDGGYASSGASAFYKSDSGRILAIRLFNEIAAITPWTDNGGVAQRNNLFVLNNTIAVAALIEISFHDKLEEAKFIHNKADLIAEKLVKAIAEVSGLVKKPVPRHFAQDSYEYLKSIGYIIKDSRLNDPMTRGEYFVMQAQAEKARRK